MKRAYGVSDSPPRDPYVSTIVRVGEFVFVPDNTDVLHAQPPSGKGSGWMPGGRIAGDVADVNTLLRVLDRGSHVHDREYQERIPQVPPTRTTGDAKIHGPILLEIECDVCIPAV